MLLQVFEGKWTRGTLQLSEQSLTRQCFRVSNTPLWRRNLAIATKCVFHFRCGTSFFKRDRAVKVDRKDVGSTIKNLCFDKWLKQFR